MVKKFYTLVSLLLIVSIALVACAPAATQPAPAADGAAVPDAAKTIRFLSGQTEDTGYTKTIGDLSKEYVKDHPNVTYEFENYTQTDLQGRIQQLATAGGLPTLYPTASSENLQNLIKNGQLLNLEEALTELGIWDQINPGAVSLLRAVEKVDSGLYELPVELNIEGFWYNKQIFADNGIEVPTTWNDLLAAAEKLNAAGIQPFSASGQQGWPLTRLVGGYAARYYGPDAMKNVADGTLKLTDAGFVAAAQTVKDMAEKGYFGKGVTTIDYDTAVDLFLQGKAALFYMGSWELRDYNNPERNKIGADNIGFFNIPLVENGKGTLDEWSMNAGLTLSVNKEQYDAALADWLKHVFSNYGDRAMSELGAITGFKVNNMPETVPALTKMTQEQIASVKTGFLWWEARFNAVANQMSTDKMQTLVTDPSYTAEQYMTDLQNALDQN